MPEARLKIGIIGGGMSGLLVGHYLKQAGHFVKIFEASRRVGGWVKSEEMNGRIIEWGPQTLMANDAWRILVTTLGLIPLEPAEHSRHRFIWFNGRSQKLPLGLLTFLSTPLLSVTAKWRMLTEIIRTTKIDEPDLSLADFMKRVFHSDLVENLLDPFVGGIYAGDVHKLSASACFPKLWDAVKSSGSLTRGMLKSEKKDRPRMMSFQKGLGEIVSKLEQELKSEIQLEAKNLSVQSAGQKGPWKIKGEQLDEDFDRILITTPAFTTSKILKSYLSEGDFNFLNSIRYQKVGVWHTVFERPAHFEKGFGVLVPRSAREDILGSLWRSEIFESGPFSGELSTTQFFAGENIPWDPVIHLNFLKKLLKTSSDPLWQEYRVHGRAIPQFDLLHRSRVENLRKNIPPGIHLAGNYLDGVGLTHVMNTALAVVDEIQKEIEA